MLDGNRSKLEEKELQINFSEGHFSRMTFARGMQQGNRSAIKKQVLQGKVYVLGGEGKRLRPAEKQCCEDPGKKRRWRGV